MIKPAAVAVPPLLEAKTEVIERGLIGIKTTSIRPKFGDVLRREVQDLSQLPFALPDRSFGLLAFGDINHGADELKIARWAENRVPYCVDIFDFAIGMNDSVVHLKLGPFAPCSL